MANYRPDFGGAYTTSEHGKNPDPPGAEWLDENAVKMLPGQNKQRAVF
jgi:hypothetical protein